jgi:crotonobetainyl-CoA:carnitine CoA-transferase CaiB-like acyl-CoA transferase
LCPYELFAAADSDIVVAVGSDAQWVACAHALGCDELAADAALRTNAGRLAHRERIIGAFASALATRAASEWLSVLRRVGVPAGRVRSVREALEDVSASPVTGVAPLPPAAIRFAPPMLDEHGARIRERGWDAFGEP